ncbi:dihydroorotate dehydrogenase electron transfer subunit [Neorhodopirellula pilleata]|uniref:Dihydroorotate dehydrogenase B (NAD(+)), electron transfer subunit n=1 Tax=Neorhodopirellula pilleata TaxID=2714738 RepID=A0A5C6AUH2_9BACT|nr:dihydroorotate dehydrogenase electron transfer subunit [Neorhodopirellula pilleata]TWU03663.1 Dihydroorotate dehydrogenase B (NAD(+)), electron transfer subunit [Neorhodopirellula pilleata]
MTTTHYADAIAQVQTPLVVNQAIAENTYLMRVSAPHIAKTFRPGQFVMIRIAGMDAPLIGRAFAIYDVHNGEDGTPEFIDLIYLRKGALTLPLSAAPVGTQVSLWGPLGNSFIDDSFLGEPHSRQPCDRLIMAVGGIGQTPMLVTGRHALTNGWAGRVEMIYGARRASLLAGVDDFRAAGFALTLCTDDGSEGQQARVPDVLADRLTQLRSSSPEERIRILTCGPEIMMEKVAEVGARFGAEVLVSMETPMACGIGICFSCVAKIRLEDVASEHVAPGQCEWDYKRTCVEGPIFNACEVCW